MFIDPFDFFLGQILALIAYLIHCLAPVLPPTSADAFSICSSDRHTIIFIGHNLVKARRRHAASAAV